MQETTMIFLSGIVGAVLIVLIIILYRIFCMLRQEQHITNQDRLKLHIKAVEHMGLENSKAYELYKEALNDTKRKEKIYEKELERTDIFPKFQNNK